MRAPLLQRPFWQRLNQSLEWEDMAKIASLVGFQPHPAQLEVLMDRTRFRTVICGRRFGKSTLAGFECVCTAVLGGWIWCVAPTYELSAIVFEEALAMISQGELKGLLTRYTEAKGSKELLLSSGGRIMSKSSDRAQGLVGRGLDLVVFDEAAEESDEAILKQRIRPALADRRGSLINITTPAGEDDWVAECYYRGKDPDRKNWMSWQFPTVANTAVPGLHEEVEEARLDLPEGIWRQQYLAEFGSGVGAVFRGFRDLAKLDPESHDQGPFVVGIDLARDVDYTVIVVMHAQTGDVVFMDRFSRIDWAQQEDRIVEIICRWGNCWGVIDCTGIGSRVFENIRDRVSHYGSNIEGYKFTLASKTALINQLAVGIERKEIGLLSDEHELGRLTIGELSAYRYTRTDAGNLKMGAPPGRHDDIVIALALAREAQMRFGGVAPRVALGMPREVPKMAGTYGRPIPARRRR